MPWSRRAELGHKEDKARLVQRANATVADGLWVTGEERIRPPAKALRVADGNPPDSHEYHPFSIGLALPPLRVEVSGC